MEKTPVGGQGAEEQTPAEAPGQAPKSPQAQEATTSKEEAEEDLDALREKYGWCEVVEEKPPE